MKNQCWFALPVLLLVAALSFEATRGVAQVGPPQGAAQGSDPGAELVAALKKSPGCIGVESAFTQSRKKAIFAWFENKKAVLKWYESDYHQTVMMGMREAAEAQPESQGYGAAATDDDEAEHEPLSFIADDSGPILCIATITPVAPGAKPLVPGFSMPIQQISIELYQPLPGGIAFNGRFAPAGVRVPHLREIGPPEAPSAAENRGR